MIYFSLLEQLAYTNIQRFLHHFYRQYWRSSNAIHLQTISLRDNRIVIEIKTLDRSLLSWLVLTFFEWL